MPESIITTIAVDQTNNEAWTKLFSVKASHIPQGGSCAKKILLNSNFQSDQAQIEAEAHQISNAWVKQTLLTELSSIIQDEIVGRNKLGFTMVPAEELSDLSHEPSQRWASKITLEAGALAICNDIINAIGALNMALNNSLCVENKRPMTLIVPNSLERSMTTPSTLITAKDLLAQVYPNLKLLYRNHNTANENDSFAMLIFDGGKQDIGYLELQDQIQVRANQGQNTFKIYKLVIPSYQLVITHPEQIAVLTGI